MSTGARWRRALARALDVILWPETTRRRRGASRRHATDPHEKHVLPDPGGNGWIVRSAGAVRASSRHRTQHAAVERARETLRRAGGGEIVIHSPGGRVRERESVEASRRRATRRRER